MLLWYLNIAYKRLNKERKSNASPFVDLVTMQEYWTKFHLAQDSIVVCLEIEQRLLYDYIKFKFESYMKFFLEAY